MDTFNGILFDFCSSKGQKGDYYVASIIWFSSWPVVDYASCNTFFIKESLYNKIKDFKKRSAVEVDIFYNPVDKSKHILDIREVKE